MNYQAWLAAFLESCNNTQADGSPAPVPGLYQWEPEDFRTISLKAFYQQGYTPERAAVVARAILHFTKPRYTGKRKSPIHLSFGRRDV